MATEAANGSPPPTQLSGQGSGELSGQLPEPPAAAHEIFAGNLHRAVAYAELLAGPAMQRGLIGPRELPRVWDRHLLNCAVIGELIRPGEHVTDVGSGAGLPGVPLALARPDLEIVLLEPQLRRASFLGLVIEQLGLAGVTVARLRAEDALDAFRTDVVVARAVAPLERLVPQCLPLLNPGGRVLAMKGVSAAAELERSMPELRAMKVTAVVRRCGVGRVEPPATVIEVVPGPAMPGRSTGTKQRIRRGGTATPRRSR